MRVNERQQGLAQVTVTAGNPKTVNAGNQRRLPIIQGQLDAFRCCCPHARAVDRHLGKAPRIPLLLRCRHSRRGHLLRTLGERLIQNHGVDEVLPIHAPR